MTFATSGVPAATPLTSQVRLTLHSTSTFTSHTSSRHTSLLGMAPLKAVELKSRPATATVNNPTAARLPLTANNRNCAPRSHYNDLSAPLQNRSPEIPSNTSYTTAPAITATLTNTTQQQAAYTSDVDATMFPSSSNYSRITNYDQTQTEQQAAYTSDSNTPASSSSFNHSRPTNHNQIQTEQHHLAGTSSAIVTPDDGHAHAQGSVIVANTQSSSHEDHASHADAAAIMPRATDTTPPTGTDGLRFDSFAAAFAIVDPLFREPVKTISGDDILEVAQNRPHHVKLLVDAMRSGGFMARADFKKGENGPVMAPTARETQAWDDWQNGAREIVDDHFTMPRVDEKVECIAWAIVEEILKVHRTGFQFTTETVDTKTRCSQRIAKAARVIEGFAIIWQRLLEGGDVFDLAANPKGCGEAVARTHRNNSKRLTGNGYGQGRRGAKALGAIAKIYMPRSEVLSRRKAAEAAEANKSADTGHLKANTQQQSHKADAATNSAFGLVAGINVGPVFGGQASQQPTVLPASVSSPQYPGAPFSGPTQSQGYGIPGTPRHGIDNFLNFDDFAGPTLQPMSNGGMNYGVNGEVSLGNSAYKSPSGDLFVSNQQSSGGTQQKGHRGGECGRPNQLAAAYGAFEIQPNGGPNEFSNTYGVVPGENLYKRRKTARGKLPENASSSDN